MKFIKNWLGNNLNTFDEIRSGKLNNLDKLLLIIVIVISALLYIPLLGNFFLIDPWENHYSHVAWETLERGSFAKLWYQNSNRFWSKPPLLFWMVMSTFRIYISEFTARLPVTLFSVFTLAGFYFLLSKLFTRRAAVISTFVLMMSPQFFQLSRQVMVDLPFVALNILALLCMAVYFFGDIEDNEKIWKIPRRNFYLYMFYFLEGWAFLAKGLLSIAIPGAALLIFMLLTRNFKYAFAWKHFKHHLVGFFIYLAVIMPWLGYMWYSEGFRFIRIFIWFHHFRRAAGTIHKPNDIFSLYIRVIGYSMFPWSAFLPAAIYHFIAGKKEWALKHKELFIFSMAVGPFFFLSFSGTKFFHYIAPIIPVLAIIVGIYISKIWNSEWSAATKFEAVLAILLVAVIGRDIGNQYGLWHHIVTFWHGRRLPAIGSWLPVVISVFTAFSLTLFSMIFSKFMRKKGFYGLFILAAGFMTYYFAVVMPQISTIYSLKPLVDRYIQESPERAPIADYYKWLRKSVSFGLKNEVTFLRTEKDDAVLRFFDKPGEQFVILRPGDLNRFNSLMSRINKKAVEVDRTPRDRLLRVTGPGRKRDMSLSTPYRPSSVPPDIVPVGAVFDEVAEIIGYKITSNNVTVKDGQKWVKEGTTVNVDLYFKALQENITRDYDVFLHCEGNNRDKRTRGDNNMAEGTYPTHFWKQGDIVRHPIRIRIPRDTKNDWYIPFVGIYSAEYRANITNAEDVDHDGDNRLKLMKLYLDK